MAIAEERPLSVGKHLFAQGNYDAAITEYKRFLYFHPSDEGIGEVYYNIGLAYRAQRTLDRGSHCLAGSDTSCYS